MKIITHAHRMVSIALLGFFLTACRGTATPLPVSVPTEIALPTITPVIATATLVEPTPTLNPFGADVKTVVLADGTSVALSPDGTFLGVARDGLAYPANEAGVVSIDKTNYTWNPDTLLLDVQITYELSSIPEAELAQLPQGIIVDRVEQFEAGFVEAYDPNGIILFIKESDASPWVLAPAGYRINPDAGTFFDRWYQGQWISEYDGPTQLDQIRALLEPTFTPAESGKVTPLGDQWTVVEPIPGQEQAAYTYAIESMAKAVSLRKFWQGFGITDLSANGLTSYFKNVSGGPFNRPYWVSAVNPKGVNFELLQRASDAVRGIIKEDPAINQANGFYLDQISVASYTIEEWQNDVWTRLFFTYLEQNDISSSNNIITSRKADGAIDHQFGVMVNPINYGLLFLVGSRWASLPHYSPYIDLLSDQQRNQVGNDAKIEAYWRLYWEVYQQWQEQKDNRWINSSLLILPGSSNKYFYNIDVREVTAIYFQDR